tara:strand:+ start:2892 stop:3740 length:849 start_codon:yes stop_codon:yes gene_type:complete
MKKIKINITEGCDPCSAERHMDKISARDKHQHDDPKSYTNAHNGEEARMHRTTLAHLMADVKVLLDLVDDEDDLPEWLETKITKAGDYMSSAARYVAGNEARDMGQLEEEVTDEEEKELKKIVIQLKKASKMHKGQSEKIDDILKEDECEINSHFGLYEALQDAITEDNEHACSECLYEAIVGDTLEEAVVTEAEYRGRKVKLNKPMRGDVKKFKVYVKDPKTGRVKKVNFGHGGSSARKKGEKTMRIRKSNPKARRNFRKRHNCKNPGPKTKARYWSCRKW